VDILYETPCIFAKHIQKSAEHILLNLQKLGTGEEWPPFLLHNIPDSKNQQEQNFENDTILN
jgi:hypothetical protein